MCFLAMLLLREALYEVKLSCTFRNGLQQLTTPLHSVSPLQQLVWQFYDSFNKGTCAHFLSFVPRSIARQFAEKITQSNRTSIPNFGKLETLHFQPLRDKSLRKLRSVTGPLGTCHYLAGGGGEGHYFGGEGHKFFPLVWGRVTNFFKVY